MLAFISGYEQAVTEGLSVRQVEEEVRRRGEAKTSGKQAPASSIPRETLDQIRNSFFGLLGVMPKVRDKGAGGVIELSTRLPLRSRGAGGLALGAVAFWSTYVGGIAIGDHGLGVKPEIWGGLIVWSALVTLALALLAFNPDARVAR